MRAAQQDIVSRYSRLGCQRLLYIPVDTRRKNANVNQGNRKTRVSIVEHHAFTHSSSWLSVLSPGANDPAIAAPSGGVIFVAAEPARSFPLADFVLEDCAATLEASSAEPMNSRRFMMVILSTGQNLSSRVIVSHAASGTQSLIRHDHRNGVSVARLDWRDRLLPASDAIDPVFHVMYRFDFGNFNGRPDLVLLARTVAAGQPCLARGEILGIQCAPCAKPFRIVIRAVPNIVQYRTMKPSG